MLCTLIINLQVTIGYKFSFYFQMLILYYFAVNNVGMSPDSLCNLLAEVSLDGLQLHRKIFINKQHSSMPSQAEYFAGIFHICKRSVK